MTRRLPKPAALLLALLTTAALALTATACGERDQPAADGSATAGATDKLDLVLDYVPNADHAGIYAAIGSGAFRDVKLDVTPRVPSDPAAPLRLLEAGRADLAVTYEPELLLARDKGADLVAIAAIAQTPLTSVMSLGKDAIKSARELKGKRVGTAGIPYQDAYLKAILAKAGVAEDDVKTVDVGFNLVPAMESGKVDATLGAFWNVEGVELQRRDRKPTILKVDELGVPTYQELVVVARADDARDKGDVLRRFVQALGRGHAAVRDNPEQAIEPLLDASKDLDRDLTLAQVKATLPVFFPADEDQPFGWMEEREWIAYAQWMFKNGLITQRADPKNALTTEFLPGEGPQPTAD